MCDWCLKHGNGKKWYLNIKNYSKELLKDRAVIESVIKYFQNTENMVGMAPSMMEELLKLKTDEEFQAMAENIKKLIEEVSPHQGQVVPIEDVREIIKIAGPMARIACVCRRMLRANFDEKTCILVGPIYLEYAKEWPDFTRGGIEYLSKEEALELMVRFDERGYVHTFWMNMSFPIVMGFCNCEYPTCVTLRFRRNLGDWFNFFLRKAEYVATIDYDKCIGCGKCIMRCQFSALTFSPYWGKVILDMKKCFGCGLCRNVCPVNAIKLVPRAEVPAVKNLW
jgi:NAD-dependent dihydropyrimidine dehydrogenase PreA subunit